MKIVVILTIFLTILEISSNSTQVLASSEAVFISEVSFAGSKANNNCKNNSDNSVTNLCNFDKWIELYNPSQTAVNLENWRIRLNGLNQKLSGQIAANSFLVLSNGDYNYQARQKVTETWEPILESKEEKSQSSVKSQVFSSPNFDNSNGKIQSSQSSSVFNSLLKPLNSNSIPESEQSSKNSSTNTSNLPLKSEKSSFQSSDNSSPNNVINSKTASQNPQIENNSKNNSQNLETKISFDNSQTKIQEKPILNFENGKKLTIEIKNGEIKTKIPSLKNSLEKAKMKTENETNTNSKTYLQIDKDQLNNTQKDFILDNFKGLWRTQNNQYEMKNSLISNTQKQSLFNQKIEWKLEKQTAFQLNSVLNQAGFTNIPLGILHSISPSNPSVTLTDANGQVVSSRSFGTVNQTENRYTMEFESANSSPVLATNMYFPQNFGTPGFGKIKKTEIAPIISAINNPKTPRQENLQTQNQMENQLEKVQSRQEIAQNVENQAIKTESLAKNNDYQEKVGNSNLENPVLENLPNALKEPNLNPNLNPNLQRQEVLQKNLQTQNELENQKNLAKIKDQLEKPSENANKIGNLDKIGNVQLKSQEEKTGNLQNQIWHLHLQNSETFQNKALAIEQKNQKYAQNETDKILKGSKVEINWSENSSKIGSTVSILDANNNFSNSTFKDILGFQNNSLLNLWINLLLLILAVKKQTSQSKTSDFQKTNFKNNPNFSFFSQFKNKIFLQLAPVKIQK